MTEYPKVEAGEFVAHEIPKRHELPGKKREVNPTIMHEVMQDSRPKFFLPELCLGIASAGLVSIARPDRAITTLGRRVRYGAMSLGFVCFTILGGMLMAIGGLFTPIGVFVTLSGTLFGLASIAKTIFPGK